MLRRLLELEVPEIYNGTVEIKSIAREAGARSKIAVAAVQPGIDPVGACVGMRGVRIQSIVSELGGEKIDVIEWNAETALYIQKALSPARVLTVHPEDDAKDGKMALVVVPDDQLSLAIGREGQNARLAAKLTNWRIHIKGSSEAARETLAHVEADSEIKEKPAGTVALVQASLQRPDATARILHERAAEAFARIGAARLPDALCHNDLHHLNVLDDGSRLWLVDCEYGGRGNRLFDLAGFLAFTTSGPMPPRR